jgi:hypothetical protein
LELPVETRDGILGAMTTAAHRVHYTVAEYLAFEEGTDAKHEYLDGQIYAMAGGTPEHAALASAPRPARPSTTLHFSSRS